MHDHYAAPPRPQKGGIQKWYPIFSLVTVRNREKGSCAKQPAASEQESLSRGKKATTNPKVLLLTWSFCFAYAYAYASDHVYAYAYALRTAYAYAYASAHALQLLQIWGGTENRIHRF